MTAKNDSSGVPAVANQPAQGSSGAVARTLDGLVLPLIEELAEQGWCVVLKKLPARLGWYFGEITGGRKLPGTWACEASWADVDDTPWRHSQSACKPTALAAVQAVAELCRQNNNSATSLKT